MDILGVVARCPRKSNPNIDGERFETLRALGSACNLTVLAEAIVNADVPPSVASFLASTTLESFIVPLECSRTLLITPLDKRDPE
jgi:hypothetical protein